MGLGTPPLPRLAAPPRAGPAPDRRRLAPPRLALVLAMALVVPARPPAAEPRGARPHRDDRTGQSLVGHRTHPRRAPEARARGQQPVHPALPRRAAARAEPDL